MTYTVTDLRWEKECLKGFLPKYLSMGQKRRTDPGEGQPGKETVRACDSKKVKNSLAKRIQLW